jgi:S-formylglutathione hydrolase FrmB
VSLANFTYETCEIDAGGGRTARCGVYLPKDYEAPGSAEKRYPWAVWLHGRNENHRKFHVDGGARVLDEMRGTGAIPELIFVALSVGGSPIYMDGSPAGDQEKLVVETLPKFLAGKYRIAPGRANCAVMGVSMGGFGALKIALRHADQFGAVAAHSSALMPANPEKLQPQYARMVQRTIDRGGLAEVLGNPIDAKKWAEHMPLALAASMDVDKLKTLRIYFDAGTDDRYGFAPSNRELHEVLEKRGVPHEWELVEGGGHSWGSGSLQAQLVKSLGFIGAGFAAAADSGKDQPSAAGR